MLRTLEPFPTEKDGAPIRWVAQSFGVVRAAVAEAYEKAKYIDPTAADQTIAIWYLAPGATPDQAYGIEAESEFLKNPWQTGTYFVRFSPSTIKDGTIHVQCSAATDAKPSPLTGQAADERRILMQSALLDTADSRVEKYAKENDALRTERNLQADEIARLKREIEVLKGERDEAIENQAPMFDDMGMDKILDLVREWTEGGQDAKAQALLFALFHQTTTFVSKLYRNPEIIAAIIAARGKSWDAFVDVQNSVALEVSKMVKEPQPLIHKKADLRPLLAAHGVSIAKKT